MIVSAYTAFLIWWLVWLGMTAVGMTSISVHLRRATAIPVTWLLSTIAPVVP